MDKGKMINVVNAATLKVVVPSVSKQKQEFYKAGVRELLNQIQIHIDELESK